MTLVTGASGFIGSHLVQRLTSLGERVRCLVRRQITLPPGAEPVYGDLTSGQGLSEALQGVDSVIHLAGVTKALRPRDYDTRQRARHRSPGTGTGGPPGAPGAREFPGSHRSEPGWLAGRRG